MLALLAAMFATRLASAEVNHETIAFIAEDGRRTVNYVTTRSTRSSYNLFMSKRDTLDPYLYIFPNQYDWDTTGDPTANVLRFQQGSYALLNQGDFGDPDDQRSRVRRDADGVYTLRTWDGSKRPDGHFGYWNTPEDFKQFAAVWVFPDNFEVVSHSSNREGQWVKRQNTLAFFAQNANDLTFEIRYRPRVNATYAALRKGLADRTSVEVQQDSRQVTLVLGDEILFPTGSAELSADGVAVLGRVAETLKPRASARLVVCGHTDDVPIRGPLAQRYTSNWELSSARSLAVVHELARQGISESRLEARALGAQQPRASNATPDGRARNRRIEIAVEEAPAR
jgi:flagellar motor protein MotB